MGCRNGSMRRDERHAELSHHAALVAIEIDNLSLGRGYRDGMVQAFADRIEAILADDRDWEEFLDRMAVGLALPIPEKNLRKRPFRTQLSDAIGAALLPGLRNVGSRGREHAARMREHCLVVWRQARAVVDAQWWARSRSSFGWWPAVLP